MKEVKLDINKPFEAFQCDHNKDTIPFKLVMDKVSLFSNSESVENHKSVATLSAVKQERVDNNQIHSAPTFFEKHVARGSGELDFGSNKAIFNSEGNAIVDISILVKDDLPAATILDVARKFNVTVGFSGSTARNLLLGKKRLPTSDIDLVYDSRHPNFEAFRKALLSEFKEKFHNENFEINFSTDINPDVYMRGPYRGLTIDKIAILSDGAVYDFTGKGLKDIHGKVLRYNSPEPFQPPGISSIFRMVKAKIQNPEFEFDPQTDILIREIIKKYYSPDSENVKKILEFKKKAELFNLDFIYKNLKHKVINGCFSAPIFSPLVRVIAKHIFEGRKNHGENYFDIQVFLDKIVKRSKGIDPVFAFKIIKDYKLDEFLKSVGSIDKFKPLKALETSDKISAVTKKSISDFFESHRARGTSAVQIGRNKVYFDENGEGRIDVENLIKEDHIIKKVFSLAESYGVTIGLWGGTVRDLLLEKERKAISDIDFIYNSGEPNFEKFKKTVIDYFEALKRDGVKVPPLDPSIDINPDKSIRSAYRGLTIDKIGITQDGKVYDFTGKGIIDLKEGVLRYNKSETVKPPGITMIARCLKEKISYPEFNFDPETEKLFRDVLRERLSTDSEKTRAMKEFAHNILKKIKFEQKPLKWETFREPFKIHNNEKFQTPGSNYLDFIKYIFKIIKVGISTDPVYTLNILKNYGIDEYLKNVESYELLKPLVEVATDKRDKEFEYRFERIGKEADLENVKFGMGFLANYYKGAGNEILSQKIKEKIKEYKNITLRNSVFDSIKEFLETNINQKMPEWRKALEALKDEFYKKYNGEANFKGFGVKRMEIPRDLPAVDKREVSYGFDFKVLKFNPKEKHSLNDIKGYIESRMGSFLIRDLIENKRIIEFHPGREEQALASLISRGFKKFIGILTPYSFKFNRIILTQNESGEWRYVITEIPHGDKLYHYQLMLRFAEYENKQVDSSQIVIYRDSARSRINSYRGYNRALLEHGIRPDKVIIGFKNTLNEQLEKRQIAAQKLVVFKELGETPLEVIMEKINISGLRSEDKDKICDLLHNLLKNKEISDVLQLNPEEVFKDCKNVKKIKIIENILKNVSAEYPAFKFLKELLMKLKFQDKLEIVKENKDYFSDQGYLTYVDNEGNCKTLLMARNPYGDLGEGMGESLGDWGVEDAFILGTAGGLEDGDVVGKLKIPAEFYDSSDHLVQNTNNSFLNFVKKDCYSDILSLNCNLDSKLKKVSSPLEETEQAIKDFRAKGYDLIEMESPDLMAGISNNKTTRIGAAYIISDMPCTEQTLEAHFKDDKIKESIEKITDAVIDYYKIKRILPLSQEYAPETNFQKAFSLSERLIKRAQIPLNDNGELIKYNIARYFINGITEETLSWLYKYWNGDFKVLLNKIDERWLEKLKRTLEIPYTNKEVFDNLQKLQEKLKELVNFIKKNNKDNSPYSLYLLGSIAKGRLGSTSDMDVLIKTKDKNLLDKVLSSEFGYKGTKDRSFIVGDFNYVANRMDSYKPALNIGTGDEILNNPDFLKHYYFKIVKNYGIKVREVDDNFKIDIDKDAVDLMFRREVSHTAETLLEYEKKFRDFINTDFILKYLKDAEKLKEIISIPLERLIAFGEDLIKGSLQDRFSTVLTFLSLSSGLDLENILDMAGIEDPIERVAVYFAIAKRLIKK